MMICWGVYFRGAHAPSRAPFRRPRRNALWTRSAREIVLQKKFAMATAPSPGRATRALPRLVAFRGKNGFRIGAGNSAYGDPAEATDKRAD